MSVSDLMLAVYRGDAEAVERLRHPDLDVFEAAALGDVVRLRELLDADAELANAWSEDSAQPLHFAAYFGHPEACALLIERGADVDAHAPGFNDVAPINSAAANDPKPNHVCTEIARLLLEAGADPNAAQANGSTALDVAELTGNDELAALLRRHGAATGTG